jgi:hypothetical protein
MAICAAGKYDCIQIEKWLWSLVNAVNVGGWQLICKWLGNHVKKKWCEGWNEWY